MTLHESRSIPAVELRVYQHGTEVRTLVQSDAGTLDLTFPASSWSAIDPDSITLLGLPYTVKTVAAKESWLAASEGQRVWLNRPEGRLSVTLIRAEDLLVQDETGVYFRAQEAQLLLPQPPPSAGAQGLVTLSFRLPEAGEGVLSYLTRSLTWTAHYLLEIAADGTGSLRADATLHHRGPQTLEAESLTLVAGDVRQQRAPHRMQHLLHGLLPAHDTFIHDREDLPEIAGLYRYEVVNPPRLVGNTDVTLPFDDLPLSHTSLTAVLRLRTQVAGMQQGVFQRRYRMVVHKPLLSAKVTVRDQGYLVGEQTVNETAAGEQVDLMLGLDPNVIYRRQTTKLRSDTVPGESGDSAYPVTHTMYRVQYDLHNAGKGQVVYEVSEQIGYLKVIAVRGEAQGVDGTVELHGTLDPGERRHLEFDLVVDETRNH